MFAAVLLAGALLSAPSVTASASETARTAAQTQKFLLLQSDPSVGGRRADGRQRTDPRSWHGRRDQ